MTHARLPAASFSPSPEQRRQAALHFDRGNQLVATGAIAGGIRLLLECTRLDPANLLYRQALRRADKARFGNRKSAGWLAWCWSWPVRAGCAGPSRPGATSRCSIWASAFSVRNPWDVSTQLEMANAAELLGLLDLAVWNLEQARHGKPDDPDVNRRLARLYERRGNFTQSLDLWDRVRKAAPHDEEASRKLADTPTRTPGPARRTLSCAR